MASPINLLEKLDGLLRETPSSPSYAADLNDPDYTEQHVPYHAASTQMAMNVDYIVQKACVMLDGWPVSQPFRLCSVGCGDGQIDNNVLSKISEMFPSVRLQYVGIDVNETSCRRARDLLAELTDVEATVYVKNIQTFRAMCVEKCDLIVSVHTLYYLTSLEQGLKSIFSLLKPKGLVIIVNAYQDPLNELFHRFWLHEQKRLVLFSPSVTKQLDTMGIGYTKDHLESVLDLTRCFHEGFEQSSHKLILDFITQSKMKCYPASVAQTCIDYLSAIASWKPEYFLIAHVEDIILITGRE